MRTNLRRLALLALLLAPGLASAGPASDMIARLGAEAVRTLNETDGKLALREARLRGLLSREFDMRKIAEITMGRYWEQAEAEQRDEYVDALSDFVLATYARRLGGYAGETFEVLSETPAGENDVLVATKIERGSDAPILAEWRVRMGGDRPRIVDISVEGASMAVTRRDEFASVIRRSGIDGLISVLEARVMRMGAGS